MNAKWEQRAKDWKLIGEALQPFFLTLAAIGAAVTFLVSELHKAQDREIEAKDRLETRSLAFYQKQLDTYAEATRIAARLAVTPASDPGYPATVARFWELYWGDLSLVESQTEDRVKFDDCHAIEEMMVNICETYVSPTDPGRCTSPSRVPEKLALELAHHAAREIKSRWISGQPGMPDKCKPHP